MSEPVDFDRDTEGKFTSGPWDAFIGLDRGFWIAAWDDQSTVVVPTIDPAERVGAITNEADACLIAAAPELYEAVRDLLRCYGHMLPWKEEKDIVENAHRVLAKARGEEDE
jgi:hypothetical protein